MWVGSQGGGGEGIGRGSSPFTAGGINTCGQQWIQKLLSHHNRATLFKALQILKQNWFSWEPYCYLFPPHLDYCRDWRVLSLICHKSRTLIMKKYISEFSKPSLAGVARQLWLGFLRNWISSETKDVAWSTEAAHLLTHTRHPWLHACSHSQEAAQ